MYSTTCFSTRWTVRTPVERSYHKRDSCRIFALHIAIRSGPFCVVGGGILREGLSLSLCTVGSVAHADAELWYYPVLVTFLRPASCTLADKGGNELNSMSRGIPIESYG